MPGRVLSEWFIIRTLATLIIILGKWHLILNLTGFSFHSLQCEDHVSKGDNDSPNLARKIAAQ